MSLFTQMTRAQSAWDIPYLNRKFFLFRDQIFKSDFFFFNYSYFIFRFLLNSSTVKYDKEIGKVNFKNNMIGKFDNEIGKF